MKLAARIGGKILRLFAFLGLSFMVILLTSVILSLFVNTLSTFWSVTIVLIDLLIAYCIYANIFNT